MRKSYGEATPAQEQRGMEDIAGSTNESMPEREEFTRMALHALANY